ncbi:MAG: ribose-phosphate diphosphokinase [Patescibacteria group bacterium]|jgi:ribose-phosphate pyrophosphokinase
MKTRTYTLPEPTAVELRLLRLLSGSGRLLAHWERFSNGELFVSAAGVVDRTCVVARTYPPEENLVRSLLLVDTLRRNGSRDIRVILPYFAYGRQDEISEPGDALSAVFVADQFRAAGASVVVSADVHNMEALRAAKVKVVDVPLAPVFARVLRSGLKSDQFTVVSPDEGGRPRAERLAKLLPGHPPVVHLKKHRQRFAGVRLLDFVGAPVGDTAVIVDDMVDTAGTLELAVGELRRRGFKRLFLCATHPILSGPAVARLRRMRFARILFSDSIGLSPATARLPGLKVVSCAEALASASR